MRSAFLYLLLSAMAAALLVINARRSSEATAPAGHSTFVTEQHWPKQALDRTAEVKRQVLEQRRAEELR